MTTSDRTTVLAPSRTVTLAAGHVMPEADQDHATTLANLKRWLEGHCTDLMVLTGTLGWDIRYGGNATALAEELGCITARCFGHRLSEVEFQDGKTQARTGVTILSWIEREIAPIPLRDTGEYVFLELDRVEEEGSITVVACDPDLRIRPAERLRGFERLSRNRLETDAVTVYVGRIPGNRGFGIYSTDTLQATEPIEVLQGSPETIFSVGRPRMLNLFDIAVGPSDNPT